MNKKNLALIFLIIFFVAVTIMGSSSLFRQIGITNVCSKCHTMEPYCESYLNPQDYPLIYKHKNESVSCIDCHSAPGSENRDKAYITISKIILSYIYTGNAMVDTSPLRYDCVKCHEIDTSFYETAINPHAGAQSCDVCHLTHRNLELGDFIKMDCADCHVEPNMIGRHINVNCIGCHPIHGSIPLCTGCHAPHDNASAKVENSECLICHGSSAHTIAEVTYNEQSDISTLCSECHEEQYLKLRNAVHGNLNSCISCHPSSHGAVQECGLCHCSGNYPVEINIHKYHNFAMESRECDICHKKEGATATPEGCTDCHIQDPHTI